MHRNCKTAGMWYDICKNLRAKNSYLKLFGGLCIVKTVVQEYLEAWELMILYSVISKPQLIVNAFSDYFHNVFNISDLDSPVHSDSSAASAIIRFKQNTFIIRDCSGAFAALLLHVFFNLILKTAPRPFQKIEKMFVQCS